MYQNTPYNEHEQKHSVLGDAPSAANKMQKLSGNPKRAIQEMMDTINALRGVYERETEALKKSDVKTFMSLQDTKIETARAYQNGIGQIIARKKEMDNVDPAIRAKLEAMQQDFSKLASRNLKALERMQGTMNRFGGTLREAAKDAVKKDRGTNYTRGGKMAVDEIKQISTGSISETV